MAVHAAGVSETIESARRWSGYVCPDCRFVFRVPRDHDGQGIVCPSCRRMLKIPTPDDTPPPLLAPLRRVVAEDLKAEEQGIMKRRRKRHRNPSLDEDQSWERDIQSRRPGKAEKLPMGWIFAGGALLLGVTVAGIVFSRSKPGDAATGPLPMPPPAIGGDAGARPTLADRSDAELLAEALPLAEKFATAKQVEDLVPLVLHPSITRQRMIDYYKDGKVVSPGMAKTDSGQSIDRDREVISFMFMSADFEQRELIFGQTPEGLRIEWESWVGWSDIPWATFLSSKPAEPHLFRVLVSPVNYYNFEFGDDNKWKSYRLLSPDGEHSIYGYVEKGSEVDRMMLMDPDVKKVAMKLKLAFPPGGLKDNQVIITSFVSLGWPGEEGDP